MSSWTPERIPIAIPPREGEALDSWIEAYARRLHCCSRDLLDTIGLTDSALIRMVATLTGRETRVLAATTGVAPPALSGMTLRRFDGLAVSIDPTTRALLHPPAWRRQTGSLFCPACLLQNAGRWPLSWRLPWTFACTRHHCLLVDDCPGCGRRVIPHRPLTHSDATGPAQCTNSVANPSHRGWRAPNCGYPLADAPTLPLAADGPVLAAQHHISRVLDQGGAAIEPGGRKQARQTLLELHTLAYKTLAALHTGQTTPEHVRLVIRDCGGDIPARRGPLDACSAHTVAVGAAIAVAAHRPGPASDTLLAWVINGDRHLRRPAEPHNLLRAWEDAGPHLVGRILHLMDGDLRAHERLAYASTTAHPRRPAATDEQIRRRSALLPALLWPAWAMRLIPTTRASHQPVTALQAALAAFLLIPGTRLTFRQAAQRLGGIAGNRAAAVFRYLNADQTTQILRQLTELVSRLDTNGSPIDYARRRAVFHPQTTTIDMAALAALHAGHRWQPPGTLQRHILNHHLAVLLTGTPTARPAPSVRGGSADVWNPLLAALPTPVRRFVHQQAGQMLDRHHIDEPLTWQPLPIAAPTLWPGVDPATVSPIAFAAAVAIHRDAFNSLARICRSTGLSAAQVRLYTQTIELELPEHQWDVLGGDADEHLLDHDRLSHLYQHADLALRDIARLTLTSERVVRRALTAAGTPLQDRRPHRAPLTHEWFEKNYINNPASLQQIAKAAGHSPNTLRWHARRLGIPFGNSAAPFNPFAQWPARRLPPPAVVAACTGRHGVEYVRQVLAMPGHRTQRAAATALGLGQTALMRHRQRVEHAAGIRIFYRSAPLAPTPEGQQFLRNATQALRRLDSPPRAAEGAHPGP